jgi:hypothetical protein
VMARCVVAHVLLQVTNVLIIVPVPNAVMSDLVLMIVQTYMKVPTLYRQLHIIGIVKLDRCLVVMNYVGKMVLIVFLVMIVINVVMLHFLLLSGSAVLHVERME